MRTFLLLSLMLLTGVVFGAGKAALGTSAAADSQGRIWMAYAEASGDAATIKVARFDAERDAWLAPLAVNAVPEPISADGENRPKLAFGPKGEMYVTWTSPTSAKYTGDIRFARSLDAGRTWSEPVTVHRDTQRIAHRFESLIVDRKGRVWVTWIDKRDLLEAQASGREYAGAAIYYAYSDDRGATWQGDFKLADQTCECCRIAVALDEHDQAHAFWRHVFAPNERDHAVAVLSSGPSEPKIARATFDRWAIDACPHHGPSLAIANGVRHAVWFNQIGGQGRVFYGQLGKQQPTQIHELPQGAMHADVAARGEQVAVAWKRFDGKATRVETWLSQDGGKTFTPGPTLSTDAESDQPRLIATNTGMFLFWRQSDRTSVVHLGFAPATQPATVSSRSATPTTAAGETTIAPFDAQTLAEIERAHRGEPFWLVLWDLECTYCMRSLVNIAAAQKQHPGLRVVTITTDPLSDAPAIGDRLAEIGVVSQPYAFSGAAPEALRYAIDPAWAGEKPRAYRYDASGKREAISGVLKPEQLVGP